MRIALLTNRFPPMLDGVGDYSRHLAGELQCQGHEVSVICRQEQVIQDAVQRGAFNVPVSATVPAWNWRAIRPLRAFIRQHRPAWLLVQYVPNAFQRWAMPVWLPLLVWLVKRQGVHIGLTFHEVSIRRQIWPLKYGLVSLMQRVIACILVRQAKTVVTSIDYYVRQLQTYTSKSVHLIPVGSNIVPISVEKSAITNTRQQITLNGGPIISTFGIRNQDLLFQSAECLLASLPTINLLIIGRLTSSAVTRAYCEKHGQQVHVTGYLPEADVYRHLTATDVFFISDPVTPDGEGGSSNKSTSLAAGLAAGLPVVGIRGDMNNGLLYNTPGLFLENAADPASIATRLYTLLLADPPMASRQQTKRFFDQHLSWKAIVSQYSDAFGWPQSKRHDYTSTW